MSSKPTFTRAGFAKSYVIPLLIVFLIPGFSLLFFGHVEADYDKHMRESILSQIQMDSRATEEQRAKAIKFYQTVPVSKILASNNAKNKRLQSSFSNLSFRYGIFRWMKRIAAICLITGVAAFVASGIGVLFAARSQPALYWSLRISWLTLRWFAVIELLGQGALAVALSFWITAFWFESYYVKLIVLAGVLALTAAALLVAAIFRKLPKFSEFSGRMLSKEAAPLLWQRVLQMAEKLSIAPPDNIFVGIDDNFFVTEHVVKVDDKEYGGRNLFSRLFLLETASRSGGAAGLGDAHAPFCGDGTRYFPRISPLLVPEFA